VRGFTAHDFKVFHPGGSLGAQLRNVADLMHTGDAMPLVAEGTRMGDALVHMTQKAFGCLGVVDGHNRLVGVVTDGDLRRHMGDRLLASKVDDVMTRSPKTTGPDVLSTVALDQLNANRVTALFVVSDGGQPVGIVHVHDLIRAEPR
ncbi:MAG: CBS domain-containing protein, partial [Pseudomonadota bacterium]